MEVKSLFAIAMLTIFAIAPSSSAVGISNLNSKIYRHSCPATGYAPNIANVQCLSEGFCVDVAERCYFECIHFVMECCKDNQGNATLQYAPRGTKCCSGAGMYRPLTHTCDQGQLTKLSTTRYCPTGVNAQYNVDQEICCPAKSKDGEPSVYLREDGYTCCGGEYIHGVAKGCCANKPFDLKTQCCKASKIVTSSTCRMPSGCDDSSTDCSDETISRRLQEWNSTNGFHVMLFEVGQSRELKRKKEMKHTIALAKKFVEKKTKLYTVTSEALKSISLSACHCLGRLQQGNSYILLSKTKIRKHMRLRGRKFLILPLESSDIFARLFGKSIR